MLPSPGPLVNHHFRGVATSEEPFRVVWLEAPEPAGVDRPFPDAAAEEADEFPAVRAAAFLALAAAFLAFLLAFFVSVLETEGAAGVGSPCLKSQRSPNLHVPVCSQFRQGIFSLSLPGCGDCDIGKYLSSNFI